MAEFHRAAAKGEIPEGSGKTVTVAGRRVALFNLDGEYHALDDVCPHRGGSLGCGTVEGESVVCPQHEWTFDIRTGRLPMGGGVESFPVRVDGDEIFVKV